MAKFKIKWVQIRRFTVKLVSSIVDINDYVFTVTKLMICQVYKESTETPECYIISRHINIIDFFYHKKY